MFIALGLLIGFLAAVPLGPINVYVVSQTMKRDFFHGMMAGLTASLLDACYCLVALIGISAVNALLVRFHIVFKVGAAVILAAIGFRLITHSRRDEEIRNGNKVVAKSPRPVLTVILLYGSNPTLYIFWLGVAGVVSAHNLLVPVRTYQVVFALACGLGSLLWYFLLVRYVHKYHHLLKPRTFRRIFVALAVFLFALAAYSLLSLAFPSISGKI
jgi:threonine/homoserine/homoserine lactone efflux protein